MGADWSISVSQLNEYVRRLISGDPMLRSLRVRGEISGFKRHVSGHVYFTLKDSEARVQCVLFRQNALALSFEPQDGMDVTVVASASLYVQSGAYQLYVEGMEREGAGELYLRFEALKQKLGAEGLFDPSLKKPVPLLPKVIGVVTSRTGAVLRDIARVAWRRNPHLTILLAAASVQGPAAAGEIVEALDRLNRDGRADVILCGRGGGSMEDLQPFNEEIVARAIARSNIPVISCVGHETDFTIADFVADLRAPTPSAAAEMAAPVWEELAGQLESLKARMLRRLMGRQELMRTRLARLAASPAMTMPQKALIGQRRRQAEEMARRLARGMEDAQAHRQWALREQALRLAGLKRALPMELRRQRLENMENRLERAMKNALFSRAKAQEEGRRALRELIGRLALGARRQLDREGARLSELTRAMKEMDPSAVLGRGYAVITVKGKSAGGAARLAAGDEIGVRFGDGEATARVSEVALYGKKKPGKAEERT